jgi:hypothetical protein
MYLLLLDIDWFRDTILANEIVEYVSQGAFWETVSS